MGRHNYCVARHLEQQTDCLELIVEKSLSIEDIAKLASPLLGWDGRGGVMLCCVLLYCVVLCRET